MPIPLISSIKKFLSKTPSNSKKEDSETSNLYIATYLLVLPDPLLIDENIQWTVDLNAYVPALDEVEERSLPKFSDDEFSGSNIVSLRFWRVPTKLQNKDTLTSETLLSTKVLDKLLRSGRSRLSSLRRTTLAAWSSRVLRPSHGSKPFQTVVEAVTIAGHETEETLRATPFAPLERCIEALLLFHRSYRLASEERIPELTYERLHPIVFSLERYPVDSLRHEIQGPILLDNNNYRVVNSRVLTPAELDRLDRYYNRLKFADPTSLYLERKLEAERQLYEDGDTSKSVLETAIAAEILFDAILGMMLWEDHYNKKVTDQKIVKALDQDLKRKLKKEYHPRLGGAWSLETGSMNYWSTDIAHVRNRAVHRGYRPTRDEAIRALDSLTKVQKFLLDRIFENRKRYPRTAWIILGSAGIQKRGNLEKFVNFLEGQHSGDILEWLEDYHSWRNQIDSRITK